MIGLHRDTIFDYLTVDKLEQIFLLIMNKSIK